MPPWWALRIGRYLQPGTTEDWRDNYFFNLMPHLAADGGGFFLSPRTPLYDAREFQGPGGSCGRLGCRVEALEKLPQESVDTLEGRHCQLSLTRSFEKGVRLRVLCSRSGKTVFDTTFITRGQASECLRHTFGLDTLPFPEGDKESSG